MGDGLGFPRGSLRIPTARLFEPPERPLTIIADTREGLIPPFPAGVIVERGTLPTGDYSTPDLLELAAVERKAAGDFMSSLTHERERFDREIRRAQDELDAFAIVVEASLEEALALRPGVRWGSVVGTLASYAARGVPTYFLGSPLAGGRFIAGLLSRWERVFLPRQTRAERLRGAALAAGLAFAAPTRRADTSFLP